MHEDVLIGQLSDKANMYGNKKLVRGIVLNRLYNSGKNTFFCLTRVYSGFYTAVLGTYHPNKVPHLPTMC